MTVPENFDWVKVRGGCVTGVAWSDLRDLMARDMATMQALAIEWAMQSKFNVSDLSSLEFRVIRTDAAGSTQVQAAISVKATVDDVLVIGRLRTNQPKPEHLFTVRPILSTSGERVFKVTDSADQDIVVGTDLRLWQVSYAALEDLFFDD